MHLSLATRSKLTIALVPLAISDPWSLWRMICIILAFDTVALFVNETLILSLAFDTMALVFDDVLCTSVSILSRRC